MAEMGLGQARGVQGLAQPWLLCARRWENAWTAVPRFLVFEEGITMTPNEH